MKLKYLFLFGLFLCPMLVWAGQKYNSSTGKKDLCSTIQEEDGSPSMVGCQTLKVANSTLTDNSDGTFSLAGSTGDISAVGDCATGDCFVASGTASTTLHSTSGTMTLGGIDNTNNENLTFDFETTANEVSIGTGTAVNRLQLEGYLVHIGNAGTETVVDGDGDLFVEDELEVAGGGSLSGTYSGTTTWSALNLFRDLVQQGFGNANDAAFSYQTIGNDHLVLGLDVGTAAKSGNFLIIQDADRTLNFGHAVVSNPHLIVHSSDATTTTDFISLSRKPLVVSRGPKGVKALPVIECSNVGLTPGGPAPTARSKVIMLNCAEFPM